jgi:hypothetical protein
METKPPYEKYFESVKRVLQGMDVNMEHYRIDLNHWKKFNELRDSGIPISKIRTMTEIHETPALITLEHARLCVMKYNGNEQKLRQCLEGNLQVL